MKSPIRVLVAMTLPVLLLTSACSGGNSLSVTEAKHWAALSEARHLTTRLIGLVAQAERDIHTVEGQDLATEVGQNYLNEGQIGWLNVLAQSYNYTGPVGTAVPSLVPTIGDVHSATVAWLDVFAKALQEVAKSKRVHRFGPFGAHINESTLEASLRADFLKTSGELALGLCQMEQRHPGLAPTGSSAADCDMARRLGQSP